MPLSSVLGAQSLVRPGVCTSSTRPASPFEGQLIFETDTNRVVAYDGSNWVYAVDTDQPPGLQLIKTQTIGTAVTSVTVSDIFSSEFDDYRITISGGVASTTRDGNFIFGSATSGYYGAFVYNGWPSTGATSVIVNNGSNSGTAFAYSANAINLELNVFSPFLSKVTTWVYQAATPATTGNRWSGGGYLNNTTSYTAMTFQTQSGDTLTGGTIRVYGYRNS